jgi:hypothetical protein
MDRVREIINREQAQLRMLMFAVILFVLSLSLMRVRQSKMCNQSVARPERTPSNISLQHSNPRFNHTRSSLSVKQA